MKIQNAASTINGDAWIRIETHVLEDVSLTRVLTFSSSNFL